MTGYASDIYSYSYEMTYISFAKDSLFYRALLQRRPVILYPDDTNETHPDDMNELYLVMSIGMSIYT